MITAGFALLAFLVYGAVGMVVSVGLGRFLMDAKGRKAIAQRTADAGLWAQFGTIWALWPAAIAVLIGSACVVYPARLIGRSASYLFQALESGE